MHPDRIGEYRVQAELAAGGWTRSYRAVELESDRQVVVKVIKDRFLYTLNDHRKYAEGMQQLKDFNLPGLVPVLDFGEHERRPFFVVPLMTAGSLADRMDSGPIDLNQIVELFEPLAQALDEAAERGIFHHNLKPKNILFDSQNRPHLAELGILGVIGSLSVSRLPIANPEYASPEQTRHQALDARSQVYSMAALIYHALTGQPVFKGATDTVTLFKQTSERPKKPSEFRSELPQSVDLVFLKALSKDPEDRYPDLRTFMNFLAGAIEDILPPDGLDEFLVPELDAPELEATRQTAVEKSETKLLPASTQQNALFLILLGVVGLLVVCGVAVFLLVTMGDLTDQNDAQTVETAAAVTAIAGVHATATAESAGSAASAASLWPVVISDTFTVNEHYWFEGQESDQYADLSWEIDGTYTWRATAKRDFVWRVWPRSDYVSNFYLNVDAQNTGGNSDAQYGLIFLNDEGSYYFFEVRDAGTFRVFLSQHGEWDTLIPQSYTPAIRNGEVNHLAVVSQDGFFTFFINGQYVGQITDDRIAEGQNGLAIGLNNEGESTTIIFDNYELRSPDLSGE